MASKKRRGSKKQSGSGRTVTSKTGRKYKKSAKTGEWVEIKGYVRHAAKRKGSCGATRKAYTRHKKYLGKGKKRGKR